MCVGAVAVAHGQHKSSRNSYGGKRVISEYWDSSDAQEQKIPFRNKRMAKFQ
jgi:hypothetical protein